MDTYDFVSKTITLQNVKSIIAGAEYDPADYSYAPRVGRDGYVVRGDAVMSLTRIRNAAKTLKIKVEIYSGVDEVGDAALTTGNGVHAALAADEGSGYEVDIAMSQDTVTALKKGGFYLYGFKAVQTTQQDGAPLVWFRTHTFSTTTKVSWSEDYEAYTSSSEIIPNGQIDAGFSASIALGRTLQIDQPGGTGQVINGGVPRAISIHSLLDEQYTCGISQQHDGTASPMCAFSLYGGNLDVIAPIKRVLLTFSTQPVNTGTVIFQAYSRGILIDLTSSNQRDVSYDINLGWKWDGGAWAQEVAASADLVPLLIETSVPSAAFKRRSLVLA